MEMPEEQLLPSSSFRAPLQRGTDGARSHLWRISRPEALRLSSRLHLSEKLLTRSKRGI